MSSLRIDHLTVAGRSLADLRNRFEAAGLSTAYGGRHANGMTEMAIRVFADGSYLELISTVEPAQRSPVWGRHIEDDGGPCAWAISSDNLEEEAHRLAALGIPAGLPQRGHRELPDGRSADWETLVVGEGEPGATFPFFIKDESPRGIRVPPAAKSGESSAVTGVALVVLGVRESRRVVPALSAWFDLRPPTAHRDDVLEATVLVFSDAPLAVAEPLAGGWLARRLERVDESPCAYVFRARSLEEAASLYRLTSPHPWLGRQTAWLDRSVLGDLHIGLTC